MHYLFGRPFEGPIDDAKAQEILLEAQSRRAAFRQVPVSAILSVLERVGKRWADPSDPVTRRVLIEAPAQIGFSRPMVEEELKGVAMALSRPYMEPKIAKELGTLDVLDDWTGGYGKQFTRALPRGVVLHVSSGNVLSAGALSMVEGLLTKNINLLKASSRATLFPLAFAEMLREVDEDGHVAQSFAVLSWPGAGSQVHRVFQQGCDAIVVWGGEDVVKTYREGLGLKCKLIEYGPKVSFGAIASDVLDAPEIAQEAAMAMALWDQSACSSPQVLYVEDASADHAPTLAFVDRLSEALSNVQLTLPQGPLGLQERAELTKERQVAEVTEAMGLGRVRTPGTNPDWTVVAEWDPGFKLSPLFRTIYVKPVANLDMVPELVAPYTDYLQSAGIAARPARVRDLAERLFDKGLLRVTTLAGMQGGEPGEPHDGGFALHALVKWVTMGFKGESDRYDAAEWQTPETLERQAFAKLKHLVEDVAPKAPLYRERFEGLRIRSMTDWSRVPLLSKDDLRAGTPPRSEGLFTGEPQGAHFLRSGGSTGEPALSAFAYPDYEDDMLRAARGLFALGLRPGDRVANLFMAGHLYGSFLSINRALELVGCNNFPFTSATPAKDLPPLLRAYGIEVLAGLPSWLMEVFDAIRQDPQGVRIRKVFYTGEHFYPQDRERLAREFGIAHFGSLGYGTVDAGPIGYQCQESRGGVHHLHSDHQFIEIVDPETLEPLPAGEPGELLITNLNRRLMPVIRYRIGDRARWIPESCPCGRSTPRFELLGRADDMMVVGGINLTYAELHEAAMSIEGVSGPLQLVLSRHENRDLLTLRIEGEEPQLSGILAQGVVAKVEMLRRVIDKGQLNPLVVDVLPVGGIERVPRTGKIRKVIDRRING
jgi:phenylacetate-coenzyme A ligase PaaK-like adenylate-forming protein